MSRGLDPRSRAGGRAARLRRRRHPAGVPVRVAIGSHGSLPLFERDPLAALVVRELRRHPRTLAAVLMPRHLHWLLADAMALPAEVARFKSTTTRDARRLGHRGRLWQRSHFESLIADRATLRAVADHLLGHPERSGLVRKAADYPWSVFHPERFPL